MTKKLPVYELRVNEKGAMVSAISVVEEPAIESDFFYFSKEDCIEHFSANDEKMELLGAAMIPEQVIDRYNKKTKEKFQVFFKADTIRQIAQSYFQEWFSI